MVIPHWLNLTPKLHSTMKGYSFWLQVTPELISGIVKQQAQELEARDQRG